LRNDVGKGIGHADGATKKVTEGSGSGTEARQPNLVTSLHGAEDDAQCLDHLDQLQFPDHLQGMMQV